MSNRCPRCLNPFSWFESERQIKGCLCPSCHEDQYLETRTVDMETLWQKEMGFNKIINKETGI